MLCIFSFFILWMGISDGVERGRKCEVADWAGAGLARIFMITIQVILTLGWVDRELSQNNDLCDFISRARPRVSSSVCIVAQIQARFIDCCLFPSFGKHVSN